MTAIFVDVDELEQLGVQYARSMQEMAGIVSDIRRRMVTTNLPAITPYGIDINPSVDQVQHVCSRLTDDALRLERAHEDIRRTMQQAAPDAPGALGPYGSVVPDLWWFNRDAHGAIIDAANAAGPAPIMAGTTTMGADIITTAKAWLGVPYLWGGGHGAITTDPGSIGVDCSGLVQQAFGLHGFKISGTAQTMYGMGTPVSSLDQAQPGDLLFWGTPSDIHHVAIYIGNGQMIEAPHTGAVVHITNVYMSGFAGIRHVLP
jgi:cell wall-associated NlpC family hydrolase